MTTPLTMVRGDTRFFTVTVTKGGLPVDCTGCTLTFNAESLFPTHAQFTRSTTDGSVTFADPTTGVGQLRIDPAVTSSITTNDPYEFACQWVLVDPVGEVTTLEQLTLSMTPNVDG